MPNTREKLVELIRDGRYKAEAICNKNNDCQTCTISDPDGYCKYGCIADHLIANGVTVQQEESIYAKYTNAMRDMTIRLVERDLENINRIPKVATVQKWIPVTERLPEKDKAVLCLLGNEDYWVAVWDHCDDGLWTDGEWWRAKNFVTHWMPLPEAPKGE